MPNLNNKRIATQFSDLQNDYNIFYVDIFQNIKKIKKKTKVKYEKPKNNINVNSLISIGKLTFSLSMKDRDNDNDINLDDQWEEITYYEHFISDIGFDDTVQKVLYFFIERMPKDYSVNIIEKYFIHTIILLRKENIIINILMKMKIMEKYIDYVTHDYIEELITIDLVSSFRLNRIMKKIKHSKTHFDQDFMNYMKDYFERRIENEIYDQAERYCIENEKSLDLKYLIGKRVYDLYEASNLFQKCREKIQECYIESAKYKQADVALNQEEIG